MTVDVSGFISSWRTNSNMSAIDDANDGRKVRDLFKVANNAHDVGWPSHEFVFQCEDRIADSLHDTADGCITRPMGHLHDVVKR